MRTRISKISFIVPVRNDAQRLSKCLAAINVASARLDLECIVADNGSTDDSAEVARAAGADVIVLPDLTVAQLRNRAAAQATGDVLAFVDADHIISAGWVDALDGVLSNPAVGLAGALYTSPVDGTWVQRWYGVLRGQTRGREHVTWLGSGNLAIRKPIFAALAGFDENLQTCEDVDLCRRALASGFQIVADARLVSIHLGDPETLWQLFKSERWRGRDNLKVSLRTFPTPRDLPGILTPAAVAVLMVLTLAGLVGSVVVGRAALQLVAGCTLGMFGLTLPRFLLMVRRAGTWQPLPLLQAFVVAAVYEAGRAASLLLPTGHRRRTPARAPVGRSA